MADAKEMYSNVSKFYVDVKIKVNQIDTDRYNKSKTRENQWNEQWKKQKVNVNVIVNQFTPNFTAKENGVKYKFIGKDYEVHCDMVAGYLRIYDKKSQKVHFTRWNTL